MSTLDKIKTLDKKFSWSFFGFLIGILGFGYAIYIDQFKEVKPNITFDILSKTQVLDLKENLNELKIIYDGEDLKEKDENLILITLKILNNGDKDIKEDDFVSQVPFGFVVNNGKIAETPQILETSNDFLKNYLKVSYDSTNTVFLNKTQIDQNQFFTIKILTICKNSEVPDIKPVGKISGMVNEFAVRNIFKDELESEDSFFERLNNDNFGIHVARFFYYIICMALFSLLIGIPSSKLSDFFDNKKKKKLIQKFRNKTKIKLSDKVDLIFELYKDYGERSIKWLDNTISNDKKLIKHVNYIKTKESRGTDDELIDDYEREELIENQMLHERRYITSSFSRIIERLIDKEIITKENEVIKVDEVFKEELKEFKYFIDLQ
ncbi:hypothetical protein C8N47_13112 [Mangrovibacterium marinum]|uniref:Uncharacterized protein n=1 Tax=Mangrovibacterium marinum TaxID=1639118 RepID=A0A2T5BX65_9BACT|nr:hypothetical protein [Mangrovibacterium marinum]PTN04477.1 hypothetical protein C8N47_13112 [Mangrovibacterium marinum]